MPKLTDNHTNTYKVGFYDGMYETFPLCRFRSSEKLQLYQAGYRAGKENKAWKRM